MFAAFLKCVMASSKLEARELARPVGKSSVVFKSGYKLSFQLYKNWWWRLMIPLFSLWVDIKITPTDLDENHGKYQSLKSGTNKKDPHH